MRRLSILVILTALLLTACAAPKSVETAIQTKETKHTIETMEKSPEIVKGFNIEFTYKNHLYGYEVQSKWAGVEIKESTKENLAGFEILLDGTTDLFEEIDTNQSETITQEEWEAFEEEVFFTVIDYGSDGLVGLDEFYKFTEQLNGFGKDPSWHMITKPTEKDYEIGIDEFAAPVSLKILRAGPSGVKLESGVSFDAGTVFLELVSDYRVRLVEMPDFELPPGFISPLLSMYLKQDYEANNHGALGFSSVVDANAFNKIFNGESFELKLVGKGDSRTLDEYVMKITPNVE